MAPLANAEGNTLTQLAVFAVICGLLMLVLGSPTARAGARDFLSGMRTSHVGKFFYGEPEEEVAAATPDNQEGVPSKDSVVDDFDYSIFSQKAQAPDLEP